MGEDDRVPADLVLPSRDDPFVAASSEGVGGPAGRRVRPEAGWWTPLRVLLALTLLTASLGYLSKDYCRERAWPRGGGVEYVHVCYSDLGHLYLERGLAAGRVPYLDRVPGEVPYVEYPVLTGALMWLTAQPARGAGDQAAQVRRYVDINAALLAIFALVVAAATARTAGRRPWDAALVALAPTLALAGTINWDLFAVALTATAGLAWARRRPVLAGVLLGLGTAAKLYPVLLLGALLVLGLRAGRLRAVATAAATAAAAWLAVNLPVLLVARDGWAEFYRLNRSRGADFGSVWLALSRAGVGVPDRWLNAVSAGTFLLLAGLVAVLVLAAPRRPRVPQVAFLLLAAFLVTNKVYSPQYVLWLLPLAALARPRWRDVLVWQAGEVLYFLAVWYYLAAAYDAARAMPVSLYVLAIAVRVAATGWLAGTVVRDVLRPATDPVRAGGVDDPAGGVLDGAEDRRTLRPASVAAPAPVAVP